MEANSPLLLKIKCIKKQLKDVITNTDDVEKINDDGSSEESTDDSESEELEITDLVNSQKNIETKQDEYFENLFSCYFSMPRKKPNFI